MIQLLPHKDTYAILMPLDAANFRIDNIDNTLFYRCNFYGIPEIGRIKQLPHGNWQILGEVTKDSISFNVEKYIDNFIVRNNKYYKNYLPFKGIDFKDAIDHSFKTANDSFYSLLAANGVYFENPKGHKPTILSRINKHLLEMDLESWQSYQDKLVGKVLIIQKVK